MSVMPVSSAVLPSPTEVPTGITPPPDGTRLAPAWSAADGRGVAPAFATLLAARLPDPDTLPSVSLAQMMTAMASGAANAPSPAPLVDLAVAQAAAPVTGPSDSWGAAAQRPAGAADGPGGAVVMAGERYLGVPYKWGGTSARTGFDCSGFVQQVFADLGLKLPRVSVDQSRAGRAVASIDEARPGDLVFWRGNGSRPNHIGIYAGDGRMLVAPRTGDVVRFQQISRPPDAIRRVVG